MRCTSDFMCRAAPLACDTCCFSYMEKLCFLDRTAALQTQFIKQVLSFTQRATSFCLFCDV